MENYVVTKLIGSGAYGDVYKVHAKTDRDEVFALKVFRSTSRIYKNAVSGHGLMEATIRELSCLSALRGHPHVVWMHNVMLYKKDVAALLTYYPYTLNNVLRQPFLAPTSIVARMSRQIAEALALIHDLHWIHRDLTPNNVMLTEDLTVKVGDMGLSRNVADWMSGDTVTVPYRAPELFENIDSEMEYTNAIDMWSLGVLIAELVEHTGCLFMDKTVNRIKYKTVDILKQVFALDKQSNKPMVSAFAVEQMLRRVLQTEHVKDVVFKLLTLRPSERLTAREFLAHKDWRALSETVSVDDVGIVTRGIVNTTKKR